MTPEEKKRRNGLLGSLAFSGGVSVARVLREELESTHFIAATLDRVRADLHWLADVGALRLDGDQVMISAEGREHVQQLRALF